MVRLLRAVVLLVAAFGGLVAADIVCPIEEEVGDVDAVVVALIDVHGGDSCDQVKLQSLQKIAAAKQMAEKVSQNAPISIGVHVMDTCGNKKKAVKLAFKSMVYTDSTICKKPPMLLGYLGPDEMEVFEAVNAVTGVYKYIHINPVALADTNNPYYITKMGQLQTVKTLSITLRHLRWSTFSLLHSEDVESSQLASTLSSTPGLCVQSVRQIFSPMRAAQPSALSDLPTRGVLVVGPPAQLIEVVQANNKLDSPHILLLVALEAGVLPPLTLIDNLAETALVLQLAPNRPLDKLQYQLEKSDLWDEYLHQQRCNFSTCSNTASDVPELAATVQDVAATATAEAVAAFARALRGAHRSKCSGIQGNCHELETTLPDEWRSRVGAQLGAQTSLPPHFETYLKKAYSNGLQRVTNYTGINFPDSRSDDCHREAGNVPYYPVTKRTTTTTPAPYFHDDFDYHSPEEESPVYNVKTTKSPRKQKEFGRNKQWRLFDVNQLNTVEFYCAMAGFSCAVGIVLCSLIYCVAAHFRVKKDDSNARDRRSIDSGVGGRRYSQDSV
ncbi:uncharacterized protein LOC132192651 isoform X2 [Neocloeon triangulifer]|uniref:uncharacterized protein LOC132192651 isoform X2 n=1 Tax=Neocloeon triangulifer TaxID=2078957 RepID=UPI00286F5022|nr:uncharacterized protein LOC132192651 isoform X2 [Neocloeon triangulifer]